MNIVDLGLIYDLALEPLPTGRRLGRVHLLDVLQAPHRREAWFDIALQWRQRAQRQEQVVPKVYQNLHLDLAFINLSYPTRWTPNSILLVSDDKRLPASWQEVGAGNVERTEINFCSIRKNI